MLRSTGSQGSPAAFPDVNNVLRSSVLASELSPKAVYDGGYPEAKEITLKIANGGAGQSGLIGAWADAFIQYCVNQLGIKPFKVCFKFVMSVRGPDHFISIKVGWYLGDTTESLAFLQRGLVDVAVTYNAAAEAQLVHCQEVRQRVYGFRVRYFRFEILRIFVVTICPGPFYVSRSRVQPGRPRPGR